MGAVAIATPLGVKALKAVNAQAADLETVQTEPAEEITDPTLSEEPADTITAESTDTPEAEAADDKSKAEETAAPEATAVASQEE